MVEVAKTAAEQARLVRTGRPFADFAPTLPVGGGVRAGTPVVETWAPKIECKRADAPTLTRSMRIALADLKLDELHVVYPGDRRYALADKVDVVPLAEFVNALP